MSYIRLSETAVSFNKQDWTMHLVKWGKIKIEMGYNIHITSPHIPVKERYVRSHPALPIQVASIMASIVASVPSPCQQANCQNQASMD